jgi:ferredoxin
MVWGLSHWVKSISPDSFWIQPVCGVVAGCFNLLSWTVVLQYPLSGGNHFRLGFAFSIYKIRFDKQKCISCKKCERACKAGCIDVKNMKVDFDRCVACYNCIDSCNDLAIGYSRMKAKKTIEKPVDEGRRDLFKTMAIGAASLTFLSAKNVDQVTSSFTTKITAKSKLPVTPPGSVSLDHFKSTCTACHLCISACPTNVLQSSIAEYGIAGLFLPKMDYHVNYCNIDCTRCSNVCPTGAIIPLTKEQKAITQIGR